MKFFHFIFLILISNVILETPYISPVPQEIEWGKYLYSTLDATFYIFSNLDKDNKNLLKTNDIRFSEIMNENCVKIIVGKKDDLSIKKYNKYVPTVKESYYLKIYNKEIIIVGFDDSGVFYGIQTLNQILNNKLIYEVEIKDYPNVPIRGVIEGFYGNPWSYEDRLRQYEFYGKYKMNTYVYGPKDDPYHRSKWREPYPEPYATNIRNLVLNAKKNKVNFVWAVHPGGDIKWNVEDKNNLINKMKTVYELGVRTFAVFFDDIEGEGRSADKQAYLLNNVTDEFVKVYTDVQPLILCPSEYNKGSSWTDYLDVLGNLMNKEIRVMWTGDVCISMIEKKDMEWVNAKIQRKAFIWLNYPVTDYVIDRLLMGKTYGNGLDIYNYISAFCSNPMEYAEASKVSLYSIADYTWNMPSFNSTKSWENSFKAIVPENYENFKFFCENNIDLDPNFQDFFREGESSKFEESNKEEYFNKVIESAESFLNDKKSIMGNEISAWLLSFKLLGKRGLLTLQMEQAVKNKDKETFNKLYNEEENLKKEQDEIRSRDFPGSIKTAKPLVGGCVLTPWVDNTIERLKKEIEKI